MREATKCMMKSIKFVLLDKKVSHGSWFKFALNVQVFFIS